MLFFNMVMPHVLDRNENVQKTELRWRDSLIDYSLVLAFTFKHGVLVSCQVDTNQSHLERGTLNLGIASIKLDCRQACDHFLV